jgi:hypothetical protein
MTITTTPTSETDANVTREEGGNEGRRRQRGRGTETGRARAREVGRGKREGEWTDLSHDDEKIVGVRHEFAAGTNSQCQQTNAGIEYRGSDPHVLQRLHVHTRTLLLHEVSRRLKARDTQHTLRNACRTQTCTGTHEHARIDNDAKEMFAPRITIMS